MKCKCKMLKLPCPYPIYFIPTHTGTLVAVVGTREMINSVYMIYSEFGCITSPSVNFEFNKFPFPKQVFFQTEGKSSSCFRMHSCTLRHCDAEWAERDIASGDSRPGGAEGLLHLPHSADFWSPDPLAPGRAPGTHQPAARLCTQGPHMHIHSRKLWAEGVLSEQSNMFFSIYSCQWQVRGLCGTLTWNQNDDFTTPDGDVEASVMSFAAKLATERCILPAGGPVPQDPCTMYTQRRHYAHSVCSIIHSSVFQVCAAC